MVREVMRFEVLPPISDWVPLQESPFPPRTVQEVTFCADQWTWVVRPERTKKGTTRRLRTAAGVPPPPPGGGGGAAGGNSLKPAVVVQSGSWLSMRPSLSLSALSAHAPVP